MVRGAMLESVSPAASKPRKNSLETLTTALERIVAKSVRSAPPGEGPVLAWPLACGAAVATRTRALDFTNGILTVEVPDSGWRAELQHLAPQYLAVINRYAARSVNRILFVVRRAS